ncbi:MAG TPA: hydantoinase B/oxoprolinase family protein [Acidimicrobiales bacterium]|nr:hydantoinase B/oxoprolinase family protein [Acidimicrobiales bacterium]
MKVIDPIDLEVLRSRLETIGDQAAAAVEHTAISPTVTESKDYSVTLVDAAGGLIVGTGMVLFHFGAATHAVRSTIERHGDTIAPGDVFLSNDPHNGGGLHPQDVMVQRPVFIDDRLVAWVGISAHMMDMGGMTVGSFAPDATECFQEGLRVPPVRLFRKGEEVTEVFDVFRNNIRMAQLVEMDLRGLVAGCHLANERLEAVIRDVGVDAFVDHLQAIRDLTEAEMRRRISALEDGVYRATSWTEFNEEFYEIPCALTVDGDRLIFDFEGSSPQTTHFFNSKPFIIEAELAVMLSWRLAVDLPFNEGIFAPLELRCPEGTVVNANPPAPIAAAHMHVGLNAADVAIQAVNLALGASPKAAERRWLAGPGFESAIGNGLWSWLLPDGSSDAYIVLDGNWVGGSAGIERDGLDLGRNLVGTRLEGSFPDIEILESWYPLLFLERSARQGTEGAGEYRAGGGNQYSFRPHGIDQMFGTMFGMRRWLPLPGAAGGSPGACNEFLIHRADGSVEQAEVNASGLVVTEADWFQMRLANGGGFGDPLDRDPASVAADVDGGRYSTEDAARIYGVAIEHDGTVDVATTERHREELRQRRLAAAKPAAKPLSTVTDGAGETVPLYPGVVQRGSVAYAEQSGAPLAVAPDHWTDGCPVLVERRLDEGPPVVYRSYLDPKSGRALHVEVALEGAPRSFEVSPVRWTGAKTNGSSNGHQGTPAGNGAKATEPAS